MRQHTPREVLDEMAKAKRPPWWLRKHIEELKAHLGRVQFQGKPMLDTPMSMAGVEAVFEEALDYVMRPRTFDELVAEFKHDAEAAGNA